MSESILERVAAGDPAAIDECLQRYGGLVWSLARRFSSNFTDAEDAVQEIFIEIWRKAANFDASVASEATYITMIARHRLIDQYRKRKRRIETAPFGDEQTVASAQQQEHVEIHEEAERARELMQRLKPEERRILELSINDGMSQSEISEVTNIPLGTVKTHARRGLIRLRELLQADPVAQVIGEAK
jgi:RNA polymerase sigma factor (sigma-70 family)